MRIHLWKVYFIFRGKITIKTTRRIEEIVRMVPPKCNLVVDVGTDHAYLSILLIKEEKAKKVIATDIAMAPLLEGQKNIEKYGLEKYIELRQGDGLWPVNHMEGPEVIVIAGLGGKNIVNILKDRKSLWKDNGAILVLQPMTQAKLVREYLQKSRYKIKRERLVVERKKFYPIIHFEPGKDLIEDDIILEIGPGLIKKPTRDVAYYINELIENRLKLIDNLKKASYITEEIEEKLERAYSEYDRLTEVKGIVSEKLRDNRRD